MAERGRGDWMQTFTGRKFYPLDPHPTDIEGEDIAHALSMLCRYAGHVDRFYSVAEHCWLLSYAVPPEHALAALLHDATEAYVVDVPRPLKVALPDYQRAEQRVANAIADRFQLWEIPGSKGFYTLPREVRDADTRILLDERNELMSATRYRWGIDDLRPLGVHVPGWTPAFAEQKYLTRLYELLALPFLRDMTLNESETLP